MRPSIIGLAGFKGSGKSTLAREIPGPKVILSFAAPIKLALEAMGIPAEYLHNPELKDVRQDILCGHSARHAMVTLGTEWGRNIMGPDFWVRIWRQKVQETPVGVTVIVDDVRFPGEVEAIRELGGFVVSIERPGIRPPPPSAWKFWAERVHESESLRLVGPVIVNDGTPQDLLEKFRAVYNRGT